MLRRLCFVLALTVVGCGGSRESQPEPADTEETSGTEGTTPPPEDAPPPAPATQARLIHAAVEATDQSVSLVFDDAASSAPTRYEFAAAYVGITSGEHSVSARSNDAELIGATLSFPEGLSTLVAYSTSDFPVALLMLPDSAEGPTEGAAQIRFVHAMVGQAGVDVCQPGDGPRADGIPLLAGAQQGAAVPASGYLEVGGGSELAIQIRAQHATPCHGRPLGTARFTPAANNGYTLVLVGRTGRHRLAPELVFCADPPASDTSCAAVPIVP